MRYEKHENAANAANDLNDFILGGIPLMVYKLDDQSEAELLEQSENFVGNLSVLLQLLKTKNILSVMLERQSGGSTSSCIQLSNMYDPDNETSAQWEFEIADDIREECGKLGKILHLHIQKNKNGDVYVKFQDSNAAQKAIDLFNGLWFGLKQISCRYIPENLYDDMFTY